MCWQPEEDEGEDEAEHTTLAQEPPKSSLEGENASARKGAQDGNTEDEDEVFESE